MDIVCPKCGAPMRSYERSGITVDQCSQCRGIFLDRGELERLVDAETSFHAAAPAYGSPEPRYDKDRYDKERYDKERYDKERYDKERYDRERYRDRDDDDHRYYGDSHGYHKKNKRRSFLEELFD